MHVFGAGRGGEYVTRDGAVGWSRGRYVEVSES